MSGENCNQPAQTVAQRLLEIANTLKPQAEGRIYCEQANAPFLRAGGRPEDYRAGISHLQTEGMIIMHPSGAFFQLTDKGRAQSHLSFSGTSCPDGD